ncbi:uncharacterized protein LOC132557589 [Ylistrum balloti]|uniref:uncharacterized protein LOC132557589 n=1 Tax=Ylistrum balloti TaxID=509963 RepID=UPI002905C3AA|nr:uncharacterized protein LOC132557589 [Ylistrum balloti]
MAVVSSAILAMIILTLSSTVSSYATGYRKVERSHPSTRRFADTLTLEPYEMRCSSSMVCGYAVCEWRQDLLDPDDSCNYLLSTCVCPTRQSCVPTNPSPSSSVPASGFNVFEYHCQ